MKYEGRARWEDIKDFMKERLCLKYEPIKMKTVCEAVREIWRYIKDGNKIRISQKKKKTFYPHKKIIKKT